jgi:hypothetical protein
MAYHLSWVFIDLDYWKSQYFHAFCTRFHDEVDGLGNRAFQIPPYWLGLDCVNTHSLTHCDEIERHILLKVDG